MADAIFQLLILDDADDAVGVVVETLVAQLVLHEEHDEQATGQPDGQPGHVDDGIRLVLLQIAKRDFQVVF